jgi:hypothetical protein
MLIISGSSPKQQILGQRSAPCAACRQETPHRFQRNYRVNHVFWFPLFSTGTTYASVCERCNLTSPTGAPPPGTVPPAPLLHRMGFLFPLGFVLFPLVLMPVVFGVSSAASGGGAQADTQMSQQSFRADTADSAARSALQDDFDDLGLRGLSIAATSASANGRKVRLLTAHYSRLKKVGDADRVRLLERMEQIADTQFPDDEVFVGLQGRVLWGGHSHRKGGEKWSRLVDESTPSPERDARVALRALELAAAAPPAATTAADARP